MTDPADSGSSQTPRRFRFGFSIRILLFATALMAVILTWGITRYKECRKEIAIVEELRADNVKIKRLPLTTFEKILGERFTKQSWEVNLDAQPEHL